MAERLPRRFTGAFRGENAEIAYNNENVESYGKATGVGADKGQSLWSYDKNLAPRRTGAGALADYNVGDIIDIFGHDFEAGTLFLGGFLRHAGDDAAGRFSLAFITPNVNPDGSLSRTAETANNLITGIATAAALTITPLTNLAGYCHERQGRLVLECTTAGKLGVATVIGVEYIA